MSSHSHNEQLKPTPFEVTQAPAASAAAPAAPARHGPPLWVLPALGALIVLVVLVIFWLPDRIQAPPPLPAQSGQDASARSQSGPGQTAVAKATPGSGDVSPWSDAQSAKLRKDAQDVLAELLEVQFALEEQGVKQWAPERYAAIAAIAAAGDELYRGREYSQARARYEEALGALQALQQSIPGELARQLETAAAALEEGDAAAASAALELAALFEPDNPELAVLRQRYEVLPQLQSLLVQAATAEGGADLAGAAQLLQRAAAVDPRHQHTRAELERVTAAHQLQRFHEAMSAGYIALDESRFDAARKAFRAAAQLQPGSSEATSALQELETAATAHRLATLKSTGRSHEQQEQWQQAVSAYEEASKLDANVLFAREGLERSRARAELDKQFRTAIETPRRLADLEVAAATEKLLQQAGQISSPGPLLSDQINRLQRLLQQANTPVAINLRSDMQTEVIVYKVAKLGRFDQRQLTLRPGTYTAVGTRDGYRDVRLSFTVDAKEPPSPVTIVCTEPI